jgi:hypothetical protein
MLITRQVAQSTPQVDDHDGRYVCFDDAHGGAPHGLHSGANHQQAIQVDAEAS